MLITGPDILSSAVNPRIIHTTKGYVVKCNSTLGVCFEDKTKSKNYLRYETTEYQDGFNIFTRIELFSPSGELVYVNDCHKGDSYCNRQKINKIAEIFKMKYGSQYLSMRKPKKSAKPKTKRCRCK